MLRRFAFIVLALLLWSTPAQAAFALVTNAKAAANSNCATSAVDTTGSSLLIVIANTVGATPTPTDSKTNTWTQAVTVDNLQGFFETIFYSWNPSSVGTGHTFTIPGTGIFCSMQMYAFSGAQTASDPLDKTNSNIAPGSSTIQTNAVDPSPTDNELIVTGLADNSGGSPTINLSFTSPAGAGAGYGDVVSGGTYLGSFSAYLVQTTAGSVNPQWSTGSANLGAVIATFKASAGGGGATRPPNSLTLLGVGGAP